MALFFALTAIALGSARPQPKSVPVSKAAGGASICISNIGGSRSLAGPNSIDGAATSGFASSGLPALLEKCSVFGERSLGSGMNASARSLPFALYFPRAFDFPLPFEVARGNGAEKVAIPGEPVPATLAADKGKLRIMVGGQQVGKEEFEIAQNGANWVARGSSEVKGADGVTRVTGTLELHADGTPAHYDWSTQNTKKASASIGFNGPTATINLTVEGAKPFTQQFTFKSPQIAILDNNLYHQYAVLARLYDWNKKGAQTFSVLVPQAMTPGSVTVESVGPQDAGGKKLDELRVKTEDLELDLYLDNQRLVRIDAPNANAEIVRE